MPAISRETEFIKIEKGIAFDVEALPYEMVERKGIGHPDTIADAVAERASRYYSLYCIEHFGRVAHHWFDKVLIFGGEAEFGFGFGRIVKPYTVLFTGKAALRLGDSDIPLPEILHRAASETLSEVLTGFDASAHLRVENRVVDHQGPGRGRVRYRPRGIDDLVRIGDPGLASNDCNLLHGYAPLSRLERAVLGLEEMITGSAFKVANPDTGWDVKVFGRRHGDRFSLVVNMPFIAADIPSLEHYQRRVKVCRKEMLAFLQALLGSEPDLDLNPADRGVRPYLTALGSVLDTGDVGAVGRGNRVNGLITPMRPMSIEAPAGKNPLDHTGKLYNTLAHRLAGQLNSEIGAKAEVHIFTAKESPLHRPDEVVVRLDESALDEVVEARIRSIVLEALDDHASLTREFVHTGVQMWLRVAAFLIRRDSGTTTASIGMPRKAST